MVGKLSNVGFGDRFGCTPGHASRACGGDALSSAFCRGTFRPSKGDQNKVNMSSALKIQHKLTAAKHNSRIFRPSRKP